MASLAKTPAASEVNDFRPITVFGLPYRVWSSLQSRFLLAAAETWADTDLYGNRKGRQAAHMWRAVIATVEEAYDSGLPVSGITADLEKAYNTLPRWPIISAALFAGASEAVLTAWTGALSSMTRHFKVRESLSRGFVTSTGLAEGCGLSCYGMLVLDHLFHRWMACQLPSVRTMSYVDNWETMTRDSSQSIAQLEGILKFASLVDLHVDRKKTYGWSTSATVRADFRAANIPVKHFERDLGAHLAYSKQFTNCTVKTRFQALDEFWSKLLRSASPYKVKVRALRTVGWARGLHAISSAPVGNTAWLDLRRQASKALGMKKPGVNPAIVLGLLEQQLDPQFLAVLHTVRDCREFSAIQDWDAHVLPLGLGLSDQPPGTSSSILVSRLHSVGMTIGSQGFVSDQFGEFNVFTTNFTEISLRLSWAWETVVAHVVSHRQDFHGLDRVDVHSTMDFLRSIPREDQQLMRLSLAGCFFTDDMQAKKHRRQSKCKFCGEPDSLRHRYWQCAVTQKCRDEHGADVLPLLDTLPEALTLRGWALLPPSWSEWCTTLSNLPTTIPQQQCRFADGWNDVFTDGSCLFQSDAQVRVASWGAILALPCDQHWEGGVKGVLAADVLPGLIQTAFRAELFALAVVLHFAAEAQAQVRVWTDCLGVVHRMELLLSGTLRIRPSSKNGDLWQWVERSATKLGKSKIQIRKTEAHQRLCDAKTREQYWRFWNNSAVDTLACAANKARPASFWELWERLSTECRAARKLHQQVGQVHLAVAKMSVWNCPEAEAEPDEPVEPREARVFSMDYAAPSGALTAPPVAARKYGYDMVARMLAWWSKRVQPGAPSERQWLSFSQLYVDYQLTYGCPGPLRLNQQWVDAAHRKHLDVERFDFNQRSKWFRQALKQVLQEAGFTLSFSNSRPSTTVIVAYVSCAAVSWDRWCIEQVDGWMSQHLGQCARSVHTLKSLPLASRRLAMAVEPRLPR